MSVRQSLVRTGFCLIALVCQLLGQTPAAKMSSMPEMGACIVPVPRKSDPELLKIYLQYNREYFKNRLPAVVSISWEDLDVDGDLGLSFAYMTPPVIYVSKQLAFAESLTDETVLHEMEHVYLAKRYGAKYSNGDIHGKLFQRGMASLAKKGAMEGLW